MTTARLLSTLRERGVRLSVEDGRLKCDAPQGILDDGLRAQLAAHKEELLALIGGAETALSAPRSLVPLKPTGEHPPLFARPGHNGDVFCYRALAEHLDRHRPLYGVEPKGIDGSPTPETVEEIAEYEVAQIRLFQPEGPYYIAGYCAGGTVAFESARQLAATGAEVARVFLFGSPFPTVFRIGRMRSYLRTQNYRVRRHTADASAGSLAEGVEYIRTRARARLATAGERLDPVLAANRRRIEDATLAAVKRYEPGFYAGRVDVFLPSEAWRSSGDRPDEWKRVAGQVVEHIGPDRCDGDDMLREPHVPVVANLLNRAFHDEEREHATG
jgi:thioesterase domain-containing protein